MVWDDWEGETVYAIVFESLQGSLLPLVQTPAVEGVPVTVMVMMPVAGPVPCTLRTRSVCQGAGAGPRLNWEGSLPIFWRLAPSVTVTFTFVKLTPWFAFAEIRYLIAMVWPTRRLTLVGCWVILRLLPSVKVASADASDDERLLVEEEVHRLTRLPAGAAHVHRVSREVVGAVRADGRDREARRRVVDRIRAGIVELVPRHRLPVGAAAAAHEDPPVREADGDVSLPRYGEGRLARGERARQRVVQLERPNRSGPVRSARDEDAPVEQGGRGVTAAGRGERPRRPGLVRPVQHRRARRRAVEAVAADDDDRAVGEQRGCVTGPTRVPIGARRRRVEEEGRHRGGEGEAGGVRGPRDGVERWAERARHGFLSSRTFAGCGDAG